MQHGAESCSWLVWVRAAQREDEELQLRAVYSGWLILLHCIHNVSSQKLETTLLKVLVILQILWSDSEVSPLLACSLY